MANYRKSFNFRSGVQVDNDNFIVNANGLVGIGTSIATEYLLNVYGDTRVTGITTTKHLSVSDVATVGFLTVSQGIHVSSAVTATAFYGDGSTLTNIVGFSTNSWILNIAQTGLSTTLNIGIGTQALDQYDLLIGSDPLFAEGISFDGSTGNVKSSGIVTATSFSGIVTATDLTGTIDNARLPSNVSVGIVTAASGFYGNLTGTALTAQTLTGTPDISVDEITANSINSGLSSVGISTVTNTLNVGISGTAFTALNSGRIGIGTGLPTSELQIRKASGSLLEVISDSGSSRISIGQSVGVGKSTAVLRFGSINNTFDIINNDIGGFNMYLHAGPAGVGTGRFNWYYGQDVSSPMMSLTYTGNLGIGETDPQTRLHVDGISTVTGNSFVGGDFESAGTVSFGSGPSKVILGGTGGTIQNVNIQTTTGITTLSQLHVTGVSSIGIGTDKPLVSLDARGKSALVARIGVNTTTDVGPNLRVNGTSSFASSVGIGTTSPVESSGSSSGILQIFGGNLNIYDNKELILTSFGKVGIATTVPIGALDLRFANLTASLRSPVYLPQITTSERNSLTPGTYAGSGALIYNTTDKQFQTLDGSSWRHIANDIQFRLTSNGTAGGAGVQTSFFGASNIISLSASSTYEIKHHAFFQNSAYSSVYWYITCSSSPRLISSVFEANPGPGITPAGSNTDGNVISNSRYAGIVDGNEIEFFETLAPAPVYDYNSVVFRTEVITNLATTLDLRYLHTGVGAGQMLPLLGSYYTVRKIL